MATTYSVPRVYTLGSLQELTERIDKCGGSGDAFMPQNLSPRFSNGNCDDPSKDIPMP